MFFCGLKTSAKRKFVRCAFLHRGRQRPSTNCRRLNEEQPPLTRSGVSSPEQATVFQNPFSEVRGTNPVLSLPTRTGSVL